MSGPSSPASTEEQRRLAGRYLLREPVGRGGAGIVWKASDELLGRTVAIKECMLPPTVDDADRDKLLTRVMREARTAAGLDHPALVTVFDVVQESGRPWIVMEYVESRSLSQVVRQDGPLPVAQVVDIGLTLLEALRVAHQAGVLHRDVKPANVLLTASGNVVLTDFGIAATTGDPTLTTSGMLLGSPSYMPPERARGEPATPDSDVWSLAATLYTLVEGTTPYSGDHPLAVLSAVADHRRRPMELAGPLEPLLSEILDSEPDTRPGELAVQRRLERIRGELAAQGPTTSGGTPMRTLGRDGGKSPAERTAQLEAHRASREDRRHGRYVEAAVAAPVEDDAASPGAGASAPPADGVGEASASPAVEKPRRSRFGRRRHGAETAGAAAAGAVAAGGAAAEAADQDWDLDEFFASKPATPDSPAAEDAGAPAAAETAASRVAETEQVGPGRPEPEPVVPTEPEPVVEPEPVAQPEPIAVAQPDPVADAEPGPLPAAVPQQEPPARARRLPWFLGAGALVVVAIVALALVLANGKGGGSDPKAVPGVPAPSVGPASPAGQSGTGSAGPTSSASPSSGTGAAIPAGWQQYHDSRYGWTIGVPPGFTRSTGQSSRQVDFRDGRGRLLRIEINPKADPSALGDWQTYAPTFARQVSDYQQIRMEPIDGGNGSRAADWEFTFRNGGATLHVLNRGVVDGRTAHALYWQTPDSSWSDSTALRDQVFSTFQPPAQ
jgi:hypothetical protein